MKDPVQKNVRAHRFKMVRGALTGEDNGTSVLRKFNSLSVSDGYAAFMSFRIVRTK
jgi:hypothetical protein